MKNHSKNLNLHIVIITIITSLIFSCEESEKNDLLEAQMCLNKASASEARNCVSSISSNSTPLAYSLRCSSIFIAEGFGEPTSLLDALNDMNSSGSCSGGCSSTVNALYAFNFDSAGTSTSSTRQANIDTATEAFTQCSSADATVYSQISSMFKIGTLAAMTAYSLSTSGTITQDNLESALASLASSDPSTIGDIATSTYNTACGNTENAAESTQAYCDELSAAINSGATSAQIGACLLNKLQNTSYVCP